MARQSNTDLLARYRRRIEAARTYRQKEDYDGTWKRLIDIYRGKQVSHLSQEDRIIVNIAFSTVNVIAPSVAVNYPKIAVNARKPDDAPKAIITEAIVNYWWKHFEVRPEFRRAVKDFLIVGHGWLKVGYRYIEQERIDSDDDASEVREGEGGEALSDPSTPTVVVTEDRPFVERVSPFDVFVDPDATSEQDMTWIAQRVRRTLVEAKSDQRYSATARSRLTATSWREDDDWSGEEKDPNDPNAGYVEIWEFYDLKRGTISVFAQGGELFLVKPKPMPYPFGHPFVMIRNYDVPEYFYPMGDLEAIEPLQLELNATRTQMMNHRKKYARKYLYNEDAFDDDGRNALQSDRDNEMVPVKSSVPLNEAVIPLKAEITPAEFYNQSQLIRDDIQTITAVSEYQQGGMPEIRRTATEASIIQDAANARAADKLAIIEQSIARVAERLIQLAQTFLDGEQVARVIGNEGAPLWVTFDADYIQGEFDYEVEAGSTAPANESFRRQSALQMMDAMAPFMQMGVVDPAKLAAHVLQTGFGIKNPQQFLLAPVPQGPQEEMGAPTGEPQAPAAALQQLQGGQ